MSSKRTNRPAERTQQLSAGSQEAISNDLWLALVGVLLEQDKVSWVGSRFEQVMASLRVEERDPWSKNVLGDSFFFGLVGGAKRHIGNTVGAEGFATFARLGRVAKVAPTLVVY